MRAHSSLLAGMLSLFVVTLAIAEEIVIKPRQFTPPAPVTR